MTKQRAFREYRRWPLVIDEQGVRRLYDELQSIVGTSGGSSVRFNVQYSDRSGVENWSLEDLLADENRSFRRIKIIEVLASGNDYEISLKIGAKKKVKDQDQEQFVGTLLLDVSAPDRQRVFVVQSLIEDRIKSFRANRPAGWMLMLSGLLFLLILLFTLIFVLGPYWPNFLTEANPLTGGRRLKPSISIPSILLGLSLSLSMVWLFPDLEFLLGRGIERHQRLERIKTNLFWVALVGTAIGIISGFVVGALTR